MTLELRVISELRVFIYVFNPIQYWVTFICKKYEGIFSSKIHIWKITPKELDIFKFIAYIYLSNILSNIIIQINQVCMSESCVGVTLTWNQKKVIEKKLYKSETQPEEGNSGQIQEKTHKNWYRNLKTENVISFIYY